MELKVVSWIWSHRTQWPGRRNERVPLDSRDTHCSCDHLAVWMLVILLVGGGQSGGHLLLQIQGDIAEFFLMSCMISFAQWWKWSCSLALWGSSWGSQPAPSQQGPDPGWLRLGGALVDGHPVGDPIPRAHDNTRGVTSTAWMAMHMTHMLKVSNMSESSSVCCSWGSGVPQSAVPGALPEAVAQNIVMIEGVKPGFPSSSQLVTVLCSTCYFMVTMHQLLWALSLMQLSFCLVPTMTPWC